jgi:tetratricopeptide (TPR) repeat protein
MNFLPANRLRLYRNFKAIEARDFYGIIRYYERHEDDLSALDFEEYFECTLAYTDALYETGEYQQNVVMCDHLLELVIMQNVESRGGADIFIQLLFKKAGALYRLQEYRQAAHVLRELIKINPADQRTARLLLRCSLHLKPAWLLKLRAASMVVILSAALVIAIEICVLPFFSDYIDAARIFHNVLMFLGVILLFGGEFRHYFGCLRDVRNFSRQMLRRKKAGN